MSKLFYWSGLASSSILMPVVWYIANSNHRLWGALPLTAWWAFCLAGTVLKWGKKI